MFYNSHSSFSVPLSGVTFVFPVMRLAMHFTLNNTKISFFNFRCLIVNLWITFNLSFGVILRKYASIQKKYYEVVNVALVIYYMYLKMCNKSLLLFAIISCICRVSLVTCVQCKKLLNVSLALYKINVYIYRGLEWSKCEIDSTVGIIGIFLLQNQGFFWVAKIQNTDMIETE